MVSLLPAPAGKRYREECIMMTAHTMNNLNRREVYHKAAQRARRRLKRRIRRVVLLVAMLFLSGGAVLAWLLLRGDALEDKALGSSRILSLDDGRALEDALQQLEALKPQYPRVQAILDAPHSYPQRLVQLAARNPEALDFVLGWPQRGAAASQPDISAEIEGESFPAFYQWDKRWGYAEYAGGVIGLDGCGPVCLSMVAVRLTGDAAHHPAAVAAAAEKAGYALPGTGTSWGLMTEGAADFGIAGTELPLDEAKIKNSLAAGMPVICSVRPGDFTTTGHFIVLYGVDDGGGLLLVDPNSPMRSAQSWSYERLAPQIKNLWVFTLA